jgi:Carboxypeptidase regulatory-like domain
VTKRACALLFVAVLLAGVTAAQKQKDQGNQRSLQGQVMGRHDAALGNAVVYLKNTKTLAVRTLYADANGQYSFNALSLTVDYEVYAEYNDKKSDTKTLSTFDSRAKAYINLHIDVDAK